MKNYLLAMTALTAVTAAAPAVAQSFTGGSGTFINLGDDGRNSGFDRVTFTGTSGTFTGAGVYTFDNVLFETGFNRDTTGVFPGVFNLTATFGGQPFAYQVAYSLAVTDTGDILTLGGNTGTFMGRTLLVNPIVIDAPGIGTQPGVISSGTGTLTVTIGAAGSAAIPEPATWAMMLLGFGMVGFGLRSRQKQSVRVTYA